MAKFIALDMENAELNAILFKMKVVGMPEKLDELHLSIKSEKRFNGDVLETMELFCEFDNEATEKIWAFIKNTNILLVDNVGLSTAVALYFGAFTENPVIVNVSEMARCLNFEMEPSENKCEAIMTTFASIWKKQTFVCAPYM